MMGRTVAFEIPVDTSLFTPLQLQPRSVFGLAMSGWARWLREHWVSFPRLIQDKKLGVVIAGLDLEYLQPFRFFDSDLVLATVGVTVRTRGDLIFVDSRFSASNRGEIARVGAVLRPVKIAEGLLLSAAPADLDADILTSFVEDEIVSPPPARRLRTVVGELEAGDPPIATASRSYTLHRHLCEVADQWSAIALPDLTSDLREQLAADGGEVSGVDAPLLRPMRRMTMEFWRPAFFLDEITVECRAYLRDGDVIFLHRFSSPIDNEPRAAFVEWFPTTDSPTPRGSDHDCEEGEKR